jgi:hypothetical protein
MALRGYPLHISRPFERVTTVASSGLGWRGMWVPLRDALKVVYHAISVSRKSLPCYREKYAIVSWSELGDSGAKLRG